MQILMFQPKILPLQCSTELPLFVSRFAEYSIKGADLRALDSFQILNTLDDIFSSIKQH